MGLGSALFEELVYEQGQPLTSSLSDYLVPSFLDLPQQLSHDLLRSVPVRRCTVWAKPRYHPYRQRSGTRSPAPLVSPTELPLFMPERVLRALREAGEEGQ